MKISFHGAAGGVTGSCHLVECAGRRILVDCGMFQGSREIDAENDDPFGFEPSGIDFLLLTHAHLDHCGRIPLLAKRGFRGRIIATPATAELARLVMLDAAHIQHEDVSRRNRRAQHLGAPRPAELALYAPADVERALACFDHPAQYGIAVQLAPGIRATLFDVGHILGSAGVRLELEEAGQRRSVVFSGDLGNTGRPLLNDPVVPPTSDALVMETTYGDRPHRSIPDSVQELHEAIAATLARGGNVVIPTFALERAQEILFYLREAVEASQLPADMRVFLDSPMAISATEIFGRHPEACSPDIVELIRRGVDPFRLPGLQFTRTQQESMAINQISGGAVIMAGSGMCTAGRVRDHLLRNLPRQNSSVIFVGYAAQGTLARRIIDGAKTVRLLGEEVDVLASIHTINGFSAHADQTELLNWQRAIAPKRTFLVHGEPEVMKQFAGQLSGTEVVIPAAHQEFSL